MWSLLWIRLGRRLVFWCKLFSVASVGHLFLLFMILFVYSGQKSVFTVNINRSVLKSGAPIIFMPLKRSVPRVAKQIATQGRVTKKVSKSVAKPVFKKPPVKKTPPKNTIKKVVKKPILAKKKALAKKKQAFKKPAKKPVKKPAIPKKKPAPKKTVKKPVKKEIKKPVKKVEKKVPEKKLGDHKKIKEKKLREEKITKPVKEIIQETQVPVGAGSSQEAHPEAIYIGQQELEALKVQYEIEHEVAKYWRPPVGLSKELSCTITVLVDWNGFVNKVNVTKPSGALMFDIAARTAVAKLNLPKSVCGKEVNINFGQ